MAAVTGSVPCAGRRGGAGGARALCAPAWQPRGPALCPTQRQSSHCACTRSCPAERLARATTERRSCWGLCAAPPQRQRTAERRRVAAEASAAAVALCMRAPARARCGARDPRARARSDLVPPWAALDGQVRARGRRDPHQLPGLCAPRGARPAQGGLARAVQPRRVPRALPQGARRGPARAAGRRPCLPGEQWSPKRAIPSSRGIQPSTRTLAVPGASRAPAQTGQRARLRRSRGCLPACLPRPAAPHTRAARRAQVVKLSDAVQQLPRQTTQFVHGVPESFLEVGAARAAPTGGRRFGKGAYFIGKVSCWRGPACLPQGALRPPCRPPTRPCQALPPLLPRPQPRAGRC
jgi:hypothetical protein